MTPGPDGFTSQFSRHLKKKKKKRIAIFYALSESKEVGKLPNLLYEVSITMISKPDQVIVR